GRSSTRSSARSRASAPCSRSSARARASSPSGPPRRRAAGSRSRPRHRTSSFRPWKPPRFSGSGGALVPKLESYLSRTRAPAFSTAVCGHRGASALAPENTLAAFRGALEAGCDLIELDVLVTRDEELVVFHDEKLGRTTDRRGRVGKLTLDELQA